MLPWRRVALLHDRVMPVCSGNLARVWARAGDSCTVTHLPHAEAATVVTAWALRREELLLSDGHNPHLVAGWRSHIAAQGGRRHGRLRGLWRSRSDGDAWRRLNLKCTRRHSHMECQPQVHARVHQQIMFTARLQEDSSNDHRRHVQQMGKGNEASVKWRAGGRSTWCLALLSSSSVADALPTVATVSGGHGSSAAFGAAQEGGAAGGGMNAAA